MADRIIHVFGCPVCGAVLLRISAEPPRHCYAPAPVAGIEQARAFAPGAPMTEVTTVRLGVTTLQLKD